MKLPKKVKISYADYAISEYPKAEAEAAKNLGACDMVTKKIRVQVDGCDPHSQANTLEHEIFHAIRYEYDINIRSEESAVNGFANGRCQVRRDNPKVEEFLRRSLK